MEVRMTMKGSSRVLCYFSLPPGVANSTSFFILLCRMSYTFSANMVRCVKWTKYVYISVLGRVLMLNLKIKLRKHMMCETYGPAYVWSLDENTLHKIVMYFYFWVKGVMRQRGPEIHTKNKKWNLLPLGCLAFSPEGKRYLKMSL